jgi:hypothetical protein
MAGARWDHPRREKPGEGATEDRAAQAGLTTTMATLPPEAEARIEAEARMEDVAVATDLSAVAGPSGAAAANLGENGLSGTSTGTGTSAKMIFLSCNCAYIF